MNTKNKNTIASTPKSTLLSSLASVQSVTGRLIQNEVSGPHVVLTLTCGDSLPIQLSLADFDAIYRGMVSCWPVVKPLKEELHKQQATIAANAKTQAKADADAAKVAAKVAADAVKIQAAKTKAEAAIAKIEATAIAAKLKAEAAAAKAIAVANAASAKADALRAAAAAK